MGNTSIPFTANRLTLEAASDLVARWQCSGQTKKQFCESVGILVSRLNRCLARVSTNNGATQAAGGFLPVIVSASGGVRIRLPGLAVIEVDADFDPGVLRKVVGALC